MALLDLPRAGSPQLLGGFACWTITAAPALPERVSAAVDAALIAEREAAPPRTLHLGASPAWAAPAGVYLQFEFAGAPKDEGADFGGQTLRIFEIGHQLEDLAIRWLRAAGIDLYTAERSNHDGDQFGFSVAGDGSGVMSVGLAHGTRAAWHRHSRALGMQDHEREELAGLRQGRGRCRQQVYAARSRSTSLHGRTVPGISAHPALFTAINKDTARTTHHRLVRFGTGSRSACRTGASASSRRPVRASCCPASPPIVTSSNAASAHGPRVAGGTGW